MPEKVLDFSSAPSGYLQNSELITHQENGEIKFKLQTPETVFKESHDQTFFKNPTVYIQQEETVWNVNADTAYTNNHYDKIDLYGNVKAVSSDKNKNQKNLRSFNNVLASKTKQDETVTITAYEAHHQNKIEYSEFSGNVRVEHHLHHLLCDKLTLKDSGFKQEMIAYGSPQKRALYRRTPSDEAPFIGLAQVIFYYPKQKKMIFKGMVHLTQKDRVFTGETIIYDIENEVVTVPENRKKESVLIINPDANTL